MRKIKDISLILLIWLSFAWLLSKFIDINWDFFIGATIGYILCIIFYREGKIEKKNKIETETVIESEVDDAPWYR
jgi:hypothetical protein